MRWNALFDDLEGQAAAMEVAERAAEVDERARGEIGTLGWLDRARTALGCSVRLRSTGGVTVSGVLRRVGPDWLLIDEGSGREALVGAAHVVGARGLGRYAAVPGAAGIVESRLGLRHALRGIARDRSVVRVHLADGTTVDGTLDRVGADFVEVASHAAGEVRRRGEVRDVELVPTAALVCLRRAV